MTAGSRSRLPKSAGWQARSAVRPDVRYGADRPQAAGLPFSGHRVTRPRLRRVPSPAILGFEPSAAGSVSSEPGKRVMRIGVDVGGTNTDAVLVQGKQVVASIKMPTTP